MFFCRRGRSSAAALFTLFVYAVCFPVFVDGLDLSCSLEVVVDASLARRLRDVVGMERGLGGAAKERGKSVEEIAVRQRVTSLVTSHVEFANGILGELQLDGNFYQLFLKRIKILSEDRCVYKGVNYCLFDNNDEKGGEDAVKSRQYLDLHSSANHDDVCLSYLFTNKNFRVGMLGSAWTASPTENSGGICQKFQAFGEELKNQSLNTGLITFLHGREQVPESVTKFAFAHEIGHSFGSQHDFPRECLVDRNGFSYLMNSAGNGLGNGGQENLRFSPCSLRNISLVLKMLPRRDIQCLTVVPKSVCGNGIVESWEECDCGESLDECPESCCNPADNPDGKGCQLREGATCSPSEGPCCSPTCRYLQRGRECRSESECQLNSTCDGIQALCPASLGRDQGTECQLGTKLCNSSGQCSKSICTKFGLVECQPSQHLEEVPNLQPCQIHCQKPNRPKSCQPLSKFTPHLTEPLYKPARSICNVEVGSGEGYKFGYCSQQGNCLGYIEERGGVSEASGLLVGIILFGVSYLLLCVVGSWVYCTYCRGGKVTGTKG